MLQRTANYYVLLIELSDILLEFAKSECDNIKVFGII